MTIDKENNKNKLQNTESKTKKISESVLIDKSNSDCNFNCDFETDKEIDIDNVDCNNFWIFGYGSLIFKPPPYVEKKIPGYIKGYVRRFWQSSSDHRGTVEKPGRVVTLIDRNYWSTLEDPHPAEDLTWGVAYKIIPEYVSVVRDNLNLREQDGYTVHSIPFFSINSKSHMSILAYIGQPNNPSFIGPTDPNVLAKHIIECKGDSGENKEYLYKLIKSLEEIATENLNSNIKTVDFHLTDLQSRARIFETSNL